jgi:hypothetical protein
VPAIVDYVPKGLRCAEPRGTVVRDVPPGLYSVPMNIPGSDGWQMRIDTRLFKNDQTFVWTLSVEPALGGSATSTILMKNPVAPCRLVPDDTPHPVPVVPTRIPSLGGYNVVSKTVAEVRPEIEKRGLKVAYLVTEPAPADSPIPYVMYLTRQNTPVGDGWFVWQADEEQHGVIRLMVTPKLNKHITLPG